MENKMEFGEKYLRLVKLQKDGYPVPPFVGIGRTELETREYDRIAKEAIATLAATRYAVRSAAFVEDGQSHSHAGEFLTKLDVAPEDVEKAIREVASDAGSDPFSIIIQSYVEPEIAGVIFTRNPLGGYGPVVEIGRAHV